jgi:hypothetical protein
MCCLIYSRPHLLHTKNWPSFYQYKHIVKVFPPVHYSVCSIVNSGVYTYTIQVKDQEFGLIRWNMSDAALVEVTQVGLILAFDWSQQLSRYGAINWLIKIFDQAGTVYLAHRQSYPCKYHADGWLAQTVCTWLNERLTHQRACPDRYSADISLAEMVCTWLND